MASFNNYAITPGTAANVNVPTFTLAGQIVSDDGKTLIADYTGVNALQFPACLAGFTQAQVLSLLENGLNAQDILKMKAGLE